MGRRSTLVPEIHFHRCWSADVVRSGGDHAHDPGRTGNTSVERVHRFEQWSAGPCLPGISRTAGGGTLLSEAVFVDRLQVVPASRDGLAVADATARLLPGPVVGADRVDLQFDSDVSVGIRDLARGVDWTYVCRARGGEDSANTAAAT